MGLLGVWAHCMVQLREPRHSCHPTAGHGSLWPTPERNSNSRHCWRCDKDRHFPNVATNVKFKAVAHVWGSYRGTLQSDVRTPPSRMQSVLAWSIATQQRPGRFLACPEDGMHCKQGLHWQYY